jgi:type I restriction enzyme S subunit
MTALLTNNLPLLAGAPNGIKKLRELILELAVRGQLVTQQSEDLSAKSGLDASRTARVKAMADGKVKKEKPAVEVTNNEQPFRLPCGWVWCRIVDTGDYINGLAFKPSDWSSIGRPIIRIQNLSGRNSEFNRTEREVDSSVVVSPGDILVSWSATLDAFIWQGEQAVLNQHIFRVIPSAVMHDQYLYWLLKWAIKVLADSDHAHGLVMAHINRGPFLAQPVGLPPLAEQHRIVAKVDEMMALCDRLEAQQADTESAHTKLVQTLLDSLPQASDATDFAANWQRLAEHFHTLFTTESSIDALKQTLLQLAVMGKLVPQDPNDEPADELLGKITKEIALLHSEGKIRKPKLTAPISSEDRVFQTPRGWKWVRLSQITRQLGDGLHGTPIYSPDGDYHFVNGNNLKQGKIVIKPETKTVSESEYSKHKKSLDEQSILVSINGTIGNVAFYKHEKIILGKSACYFNLASGVSKHFVRLLIEAPGFMKYALKSATGTTIKNLGLKAMNDYPIALPPLAEQHNIVGKVDQLMTICEQLQTRLTQARQLSEQLASTLVERALDEDSRQAPSTTDRRVARTLLAAEITHRLHSQRTFGQRKLQKVIYLAEHVARLAAIQGDYLRDAAGPHDRHLMNQIEGELQNRKWYERIERETVGHAYRPLSHAGQHQQAYKNAWMATERASIEQVIELMREWNTDHCEMTVTLYAAWNDFILEGRPVTDEAIVAEVMHSWNDTKLRFSKTEWLAVLAEMKEQKILIPTGFGKRTTGGMRNLLGIE